MALDQETLSQLLDTVRRFVRERLVPNEARIAEEDAIPANIIAEMREGIHFYDQDTPDGSWSFTGDKGLTLQQEFSNDQVEFTWLYAYPDTLGQLETELWAPSRRLQPQETVTLRQTITVTANP